MKGPWELEPHTEAKHSIYRKYLDAWFPILINRYGDVTYAEGFSGCGLYSGGQPGSPVIALNNLLTRRHQFTNLRRARFLLVEKDRQHIDLLAQEIGKTLKADGPVHDYDDGTIEVRLRQGTCETELPQLLDTSNAWKKPILAIFDTFGGGVPAELISRIANNRSSEVIYTVLPQHFVRFFDQDRGDKVFGSAAWRDVAAIPSYLKRQRIAQEFEQTMTSSGFPHVLRFNLGTSRGDQLNILFGTNSEYGIEKFKDATWKADPINGAGFQDPKDPWQQMLPMQHEPDLGPLERSIQELLLNSPQRTLSIEELRKFAQLHTLYKSAHVSRSLESMKQKGSLEGHDGRLKSKSTLVTAAEPKQLDIFNDC